MNEIIPTPEISNRKVDFSGKVYMESVIKSKLFERIKLLRLKDLYNSDMAKNKDLLNLIFGMVVKNDIPCYYELMTHFPNNFFQRVRKLDSRFSRFMEDRVLVILYQPAKSTARTKQGHVTSKSGIKYVRKLTDQKADGTEPSCITQEGSLDKKIVIYYTRVNESFIGFFKWFCKRRLKDISVPGKAMLINYLRDNKKRQDIIEWLENKFNFIPSNAQNLEEYVEQEAKHLLSLDLDEWFKNLK